MAVREGSTLRYVHQEHLGSSAVSTDVNGAATGSMRYLPYGPTRVESGTMGSCRLFTGQCRDITAAYPDPGLYYYGARYYDASLGRFVSADPRIQSYADPQALNRYAYARNNPLVFVDPTGLDFVFIHGHEGSFSQFNALGNAVISATGEAVYFYNWDTGRLESWDAENSAASGEAAGHVDVGVAASNVVNQIASMGLHDVTVVGLSVGGSVALAAANIVATTYGPPADVRAAVAVDAPTSTGAAAGIYAAGGYNLQMSGGWSLTSGYPIPTNFSPGPLDASAIKASGLPVYNITATAVSSGLSFATNIPIHSSHGDALNNPMTTHVVVGTARGAVTPDDPEWWLYSGGGL